jgi:hypothetical protein
LSLAGFAGLGTLECQRTAVPDLQADFGGYGFQDLRLATWLT